MYLSRIILLTACTLTMTGCSNIQRGFSNFFFPPNAYSDRRDGESVKIQLHNDKSRKELETDLSERKKACTVALQQDSIFLSEHKSEIDKSSKEDVAKFECESKFVAIPPPLVAAAATAALGEVQKFLKAEAERYSASYSAAVANDTFYDSWAPGAKINLKGLTVQRKVGTKAQKDMGMELCMAVEPTLDGSAFRLYPIYAQVHRAKAKLIAFDWLAPLGFDLLAPWTVFSSDTRGYDNDVDLKVEISLHGIWVDGKPEMHNQLLAKEEIKLGSLQLSRTTGEGIFFLPIKDENVKTVAKEVQKRFSCDQLKPSSSGLTIEGKMLTDLFDFPDSNTHLFQAVPRSEYNIKEKHLGTGNYILSVLVSEYDNYGERVKEVSSKLDGQKEGILKGLGSLFE